MALLHSAFYFFFLYPSYSLSLCTVFDSISSNIAEILPINPSPKVFVFGDFNVHLKGWLTNSGETDRPGELSYIFSISNDLTHIANFPTQIPDFDSDCPALYDLFISSDTSICSTVAFSPLGDSDHVVVSVFIDFPLNPQRHAPYHRIAYDYSGADWDSLRDNLRMFYGRISLNSVLLLLLVNFVSGPGWNRCKYPLIVSVRSSLSHFHGFKLLVLLS